ncbi:MAG: response regulator transcription factor [Saprospiraceae bacterium]|uniref:Response regulator transcription factor n=1 Tax=Candidatus Opimibacter skivensis TaxID=2982028 RepID=A0A9D7T1G9_9BACT|nr:response regulator transcription factor [Candidatus Opimibacter skivensis]
MKILLIEDEEKAVKILKKGLNEHNIEVDFAFDGIKGGEMALANEYDVIVSDIIVPGLNGFDLTRHLRQKGIKTPVLLLTALNATDDKVLGLEVGADDYLTKPYEFKELLARLKALSRRGKEVPPPKLILTFADTEMNLTGKEFIRQGKKIELTPKEFALMEYFIRHQGRVISKAEIADKVWDINFETTSNVVEVYVNYLRNKVDKPFEKKIIHTVFGVGYVLKDE